MWWEEQKARTNDRLYTIDAGYVDCFIKLNQNDLDNSFHLGSVYILQSNVSAIKCSPSPPLSICCIATQYSIHLIDDSKMILKSRLFYVDLFALNTIECLLNDATA